jgi:hypothetical protein
MPSGRSRKMIGVRRRRFNSEAVGEDRVKV